MGRGVGPLQVARGPGRWFDGRRGGGASWSHRQRLQRNGVSTSCLRGCGPWAAPCSRARPVSDLDRISVQDSISSPTHPLPRRVWSMSRHRTPCTMLRAAACDAACRSAHRRVSCWLSTTAACRPRLAGRSRDRARCTTRAPPPACLCCNVFGLQHRLLA